MALKTFEMKIIILFASLFFCCGYRSVAQSIPSNCKKEFDEQLNMFVYSEVDSPPLFPGGNKAFLAYFAENYSQPDTSSVYQSDFKLQFIIDTVGNVLNEQIRKKRLNDLSLQEKDALKLLHNMPKWRPGKCNGILVPVKVNIPLKF